MLRLFYPPRWLLQIAISLFLLFFVLSPQPAQAASCKDNPGINFQTTPSHYLQPNQLVVRYLLQGIDQGTYNYILRFTARRNEEKTYQFSNRMIEINDPDALTFQGNLSEENEKVEVYVEYEPNERCILWEYYIPRPTATCNVTWTVDQYPDSNPGCVQTNETVTVNISDASIGNGPFTGTARLLLGGNPTSVQINNGHSADPVIFQSLPDADNDQLQVWLQPPTINDPRDFLICYEQDLLVQKDCADEERQQSTSTDIPPFNLCNSITSNANGEQEKCKQCLGNPDKPTGIWTAVGCVRFGSKEFIEDVLKLVTGIGGGIALLMMVIGAFQISLSAGDPKALQTGKNTLTSAIIGILVIIFSVVILNIIGVEVLKIPGF